MELFTIIKLFIILGIAFFIGKVFLFPKEGDTGIIEDPLRAIQNSLNLGNFLNSREARHSESASSETPISAKWCSVGSFQGVNGCVEVGDANLCTSGQVFSSRELCLNPATSGQPDLAGNKQRTGNNLLPTPVIFSRPIIQPLAPNPLYT